MTTKSRIRSLSRRGTRSTKSPAVAQKGLEPRTGTVCQRCGAQFSRRTWRRDRPLTHARLAAATWGTCPGCAQARGGEYHGRVLLRGGWVRTNEDAVRRRIANVAARAGATQPERQLVSVGPDGEGLEVLTTSQKLAHRIVTELKKAFRGRASYSWSGRDGSLEATWRRDTGRA
jgi:NMD protein affecting ribosome stability and mRNA decay